MKIKTKILFKLYGGICWIDRNNEPHYFYLPEQKALFRWALTPTQAKFYFKKIIQIFLKKQNPRCCPKLSQILLNRAKIKQVKSKKEVIQKQFKLFKKPS
ncbi:MAG: hypothetical protein ACOC56_06440 [Atribacterota bacterium]